MRHPDDQPTARELEVAGLLARGHGYPDIAQILSLHVTTVKNHIHSLYGKLGVSSVQGLIATLFVLERKPDFRWPADG